MRSSSYRGLLISQSLYASIFSESFLCRIFQKPPVEPKELQQVSISVVSSISNVSSIDWDACAVDANGQGIFNPFLSHAFLSCLEESGCAVQVFLIY